MKRTASLMALVFLVFLVMPAATADYTWPVVTGIDGDSVKVAAGADLPPEAHVCRGPAMERRHAGARPLGEV